jgi:transcription elongation factor Elf1
MIAKCSCPHCGQHIEFEVENVGVVAPCPTCGNEFTLTVPAIAPPVPVKAQMPDETTPATIKKHFDAQVIFTLGGRLDFNSQSL